MRWISDRRLRTALAGAGLLFIGYSLVREGIPIEEMRNLSFAQVLKSVIAVLTGVLGSALAWSVLVERPFLDSGKALLESLPSKYLPGGFGLPLSQMSHQYRSGDSVSRTAGRLVQHFLISVGSGGAAFLALSQQSGDGLWWQIPIAVLFLAVGFIAFPVILERFPRPAIARNLELAQAPRVLVASAVTWFALIVLAVGYDTVLDGLVVGDVGAVAAFVLAWTIGYAVVPVPAGLGLRESVLVVSLQPLSGATVVLAAVIFRGLAVLVEIGVAGLARILPASKV